MLLSTSILEYLQWVLKIIFLQPENVAFTEFSQYAAKIYLFGVNKWKHLKKGVRYVQS